MKCRKCGEIGNVLVRVNEKGVPGEWECSPCCDIPFISNEAALIYTLTLAEIDNEAEVKE